MGAELDEQQQRALDRECGLLALVLETGGIGLWTWDEESGQMAISDSWFELTGHPAEPVRQMLHHLAESELSEKEQLKHLINWWAEFVHPDDVDAAKQRIERYLLLRMGGDGYSNLYRFRHGYKNWISIRSQGRAEWQNERLKSLSIVQTEVTELAETERRLRTELSLLKESQRKFLEAQAKTSLTLEEQAIALRALRVLVTRLIPIAIALLAPLTNAGEEIISRAIKTVAQPRELRALPFVQPITPRLED